MKYTKTEEKKFLHDKIIEWLGNHKKMIRLILLIVHVIFTIIIGMYLEAQDNLNNYPEQEYQQLEQEFHSIIVEYDGIYPEKLSRADIKYDILYHEYDNSEGEYEIKLTDTVTVIATIGKDLNKEDLIIEREYSSESEYRSHYELVIIKSLIGIPLMLDLILILHAIVLLCWIIFIDMFLTKYSE